MQSSEALLKALNMALLLYISPFLRSEGLSISTGASIRPLRSFYAFDLGLHFLHKILLVLVPFCVEGAAPFSGHLHSTPMPLESWTLHLANSGSSNKSPVNLFYNVAIL
jgi:hypothetical protein